MRPLAESKFAFRRGDQKETLFWRKRVSHLNNNNNIYLNSIVTRRDSILCIWWCWRGNIKFDLSIINSSMPQHNIEILLYILQEKGKLLFKTNKKGNMGIFSEICWSIFQWKKSLVDVSYRCQYNQNNLVIVVEVVEPNSFIILG